jgi:hypothetical protein
MLRTNGVFGIDLGGGVRPGDGVYRFKERFHGLAKPLHGVRQIYNPAKYEELCRAAGVLASLSYFPAYRSGRLCVSEGASAEDPVDVAWNGRRIAEHSRFREQLQRRAESVSIGRSAHGTNHTRQRCPRRPSVLYHQVGQSRVNRPTGIWRHRRNFHCCKSTLEFGSLRRIVANGETTIHNLRVRDVDHCVRIRLGESTQ